MAAINHGGTFYRLDKSSQSGDCGEANVMALHLASKQVMPFAFAVKGIPFGYSLTQVKAQSNCIRAGSFSPFPSFHASGKPGGSSTASTHNPYKEVIFNREGASRTSYFLFRHFQTRSRPNQAIERKEDLPRLLVNFSIINSFSR